MWVFQVSKLVCMKPGDVVSFVTSESLLFVSVSEQEHMSG